MTCEQTIQAELDAHNVKMALENGTNTVKTSYVSKVVESDRAISFNEWHEQAKDVKYSANNSTTIFVKPQDCEVSE